MTNKCLQSALATAYRHLPRHEQFHHYIHYSFVVKKNKIVAWGTNRTGSPPLHFGYNKKSGAPKLHAELVAYRRARGIIKAPFQLINIHCNRKGEWKNATPCFVCQTWLASVGCTTVWSTHPTGWEKVSL